MRQLTDMCFARVRSRGFTVCTTYMKARHCRTSLRHSARDGDPRADPCTRSGAHGGIGGNTRKDRGRAGRGTGARAAGTDPAGQGGARAPEAPPVGDRAGVGDPVPAPEGMGRARALCAGGAGPQGRGSARRQPRSSRDHGGPRGEQPGRDGSLEGEQGHGHAVRPGQGARGSAHAPTLRHPAQAASARQADAGRAVEHKALGQVGPRREGRRPQDGARDRGLRQSARRQGDRVRGPEPDAERPAHGLDPAPEPAPLPVDAGPDPGVRPAHGALGGHSGSAPGSGLHLKAIQGNETPITEGSAAMACTEAVTYARNCAQAPVFSLACRASHPKLLDGCSSAQRTMPRQPVPRHARRIGLRRKFLQGMRMLRDEPCRRVAEIRGSQTRTGRAISAKPRRCAIDESRTSPGQAPPSSSRHRRSACTQP